jgi:hypothetical protein
MPGVRKSLLLGALVLTAVPTPAHAQSGNGLYKPAPAANSIQRSKDFVKDLRTSGGAGVKLSEKQLEDGVVVDSRTGRLSPVPAVDEGASDRADGGSGLGGVIVWSAALALIALAATGLRRLPSGPAPRRT